MPAAEGGLRILVHLEQWEPGFPGEPGGVGVFGGDDEVFSVDASYLDPALAVGKGYGDVPAFCDDASDRAVAHAEGSSLPHQEPGEAFAIAGGGQGARLVRAASPLHNDGLEPSVD